MRGRHEEAPLTQARPLFFQFTNRCLLKWLKLWDLVVFGERSLSGSLGPVQNRPVVAGEAPTSSKWKSHEQVLEEMLEAELDPSGRPRQKVSAPDCSAHMSNGCILGGWSLCSLWGP